MTFGPPSPTASTLPGGLDRGVLGNYVVTFQNQPLSLEGDSSNSDTYPTFARYRQSQYTRFDAFAERIRKALETVNA